MRILFYGLNYYPELTGIGKYSSEMCEWLAAQDHDVRVISAPPYYPEWKVNCEYSSWFYQVETHNNVKIYRSPLYVPNKPRLISRIMHLLSFALSSIPLLIAQLFWRPTIIITVEPTLFCAPNVLIFSFLSKAKSVLHVQDFEIDAMLGLKMASRNILTKFSLYIESWLMQKFDLISSISTKMCALAETKVNNTVSVYLFPNWADIDFITPNDDSTYYRKKWDIPESTIVLLYSGNLGKKQGLSLLIDAAFVLQSSLDCIFVIVGGGSIYEELVYKAKKYKLSNIRFYPLQPYSNLPKLMLLADLHLIIQKKGVADVVLPSKLTSILSSGGRSLITAEAGTELGELCNNHPEFAIIVEPENLDIFTSKIKSWCETFDYTKRCPSYEARLYAENHINKEKLLIDFEKKILGLRINVT